MVTVAYPYDDIELMFLECVLTREQIPYFVVGKHFGSIYPGPQIASYNEKIIKVPDEYYQQATTAINEFRDLDVRKEKVYCNKSKLRMFAEIFLFWWFIPGGCRKSSNNQINQDAQLNAEH